MDVQAIENETDYDNALAKVEMLWGAAIGSEDGNKLDKLITLVEEYEEIHYQIGKGLKDVQEGRTISLNEARKNLRLES